MPGSDVTSDITSTDRGPSLSFLLTPRNDRIFISMYLNSNNKHPCRTVRHTEVRYVSPLWRASHGSETWRLFTGDDGNPSCLGPHVVSHSLPYGQTAHRGQLWGCLGKLSSISQTLQVATLWVTMSS